MATFKQSELLIGLEHQAEENLQHAISTFQNLTSEQLNRPSATGGWSVAQCLWHLNSYGDYYHPLLAKAISSSGTIPAHGRYVDTWLGGKFARMMDPTTGTTTMKAFKANTPPARPEGYEVVARFIGQQEQLLGYLRSARGRDIQNAKIPVSIIRWLQLPVGDVFRFLVAHDRRHVLQALRNLSNRNQSL